MKYVVFAAVVAVVLASCATVPSLGPKPEMRDVRSYLAERSVATAAAPGDWPEPEWWKVFGDPQLDTLMTDGLRDSPTVAAARARVQRAEALAQVTGAVLEPSVAAGATAAFSKPSYNTGLPTPPALHGWNDVGRLGLDFSFELDFWGKNRAALASAIGEAQALAADFAGGRVILVTAIATTYAELAAIYADRDVLERTVAIREQTLALVRRRYEFGYDSEAELRQTEAGPPTARAQLIRADEALALTRNQIAVLIGAGPDRALDIKRPTSRASGAPVLPPSLPAELLGRRPDLTAARLRANAAARRIDVAVAQFRPNINLLAAVGQQSLGVNTLFARGSTVGSAGPAISLPVFDGGRRAGGYRAARAEYDAAVFSYDVVLTRALEEVSDVLIQMRAVALRLTEEKAALDANDQALRLSRARFTAGATDLQAVLIAEDRLLTSQRLFAADEARRMLLDVALARALGGGWERVRGFSYVPPAGASK